MPLISSDEYCPHCDNHFVLEAVTPKPTLQVEGEDARMDSRYVEGRGESVFAVKADICVECSRMTAFGATKNDPCSIYAISPTGWARGWSISSSPFHDPNDFPTPPTIHLLPYYPPPVVLDLDLHAINTCLCSTILYGGIIHREVRYEMCRNFVVLSPRQVKETSATGNRHKSQTQSSRGMTRHLLHPSYSAVSPPPGRVRMAAVAAPPRLVFFLAASSCFSVSMLLT